MKHWLKTFLQLVIIIAVPVVLAIFPVRLLMHPRWVYFEYSRADFPPDHFGFTPQERTRLAVVGIDSIIGPRGVAALQKARLPDGSPAFNEREVSHMLDVRVVTAKLYAAQMLLLAAATMAMAALTRREQTRPAVPSALLRGAVVTVVLLVALVMLVFAGFDTFFTSFHRVFFSGDTWLFSMSDTLIRLYPVQFWFDASVVIGIATIVESLVLGGLAWLWGKRQREQAAR